MGIPEVQARPGDRVLVPILIDGLNGREIVSGDVRVRFNPEVLTADGAVLEGSLIGDQRWLTGDAIDTETSAEFHQIRVVFAAARGFSADGDLVFLSFQVSESALVGTAIDLELVAVALNNGEPVPVLSSGAVRIVEEVIVAAFVAEPRQGQAALEVRFSDRSAGPIESYQWEFGDGGTSTARNPVHTYLQEGLYTVRVTVTAASGADTEERAEYIHVLPDTTAPEGEARPEVADAHPHAQPAPSSGEYIALGRVRVPCRPAMTPSLPITCPPPMSLMRAPVAATS